MKLRLFPGLFALAVATVAQSAEVAFRSHTLNAGSEYSACAVIDVNRDGKLDVFCGGWWYEAPTWKKHFVRNVRKIRGRFDGYSHLPMDVNADGWIDVVNVNWRSESLFWVKHPGRKLGEWAKVKIAKPGSMETGRLADVDGDGRLDILPNGVKFAAWWELAKPAPEPQWVRHDLPAEVAAHGVGFGDVNGDGRSDVIGPYGWLEAPVDRRKGKWQWRAEYKMERDTGIPILARDVDGDGDNDLLWARGHNYGVYWMEQARNAAGEREWKRHEIDRTWSQGHSLLWADLDGDGVGELIPLKPGSGPENIEEMPVNMKGIHQIKLEKINQVDSHPFLNLHLNGMTLKVKGHRVDSIHLVVSVKIGVEPIHDHDHFTDLRSRFPRIHDEGSV